MTIIEVLGVFVAEKVSDKIQERGRFELGEGVADACHGSIEKINIVVSRKRPENLVDVMESFRHIYFCFGMKLSICEDYHVLRGCLIDKAEDRELGKENPTVQVKRTTQSHILMPYNWIPKAFVRSKGWLCDHTSTSTIGERLLMG